MFYGVAKGKNIGVYYSWIECKEQISGYSGAVFKKFICEKDAEDFILNINKSNIKLHDDIYGKFDDENVDYKIYTDGSCYNNGGDNPIMGIGINFGNIDEKNISDVILDLSLNSTNNLAEIIAIITAINNVKNNNNLKNKNTCIMSDSEYAIKCATSYGDKCNRDNWSKNIPNKDYVKKLYNLYQNSENIKLKHIYAHTNKKDIDSIGNKIADELAYNAVKKYRESINLK